MSVMLYPCMLCVALLLCLFVLCVACLTVFVNCLVKQFAMCLGVVAILLFFFSSSSSSSRVATSHFCYPLLHTSLRSVIVYQQVISCTRLWQEWEV